ncbi:adenylate cyclase type 3-like [Malurus melanocephalus]|uniref:adenylate cyclase type 3-like n=1 Tax=Malurus melanocephalus TaxID=175006 RepID=UPI0025499E7F|nr:adenylate cyclase type 3-like [Malurus melanocephalus]
MARSRAFSEPEFSAEYSAEYSLSFPSDAERSRESPARRGGPCPCFPRSRRLSFSPESLEKLYQTYFRRQRHETLLVLVVFAALFDCYVLGMCAPGFSRPDRPLEKLPLALGALAALLAHGALFVLLRARLLPERLSRDFLPGALWALIAAQVWGYVALEFRDLPEAVDSLGWQAFFAFSCFLTLPLRLARIVLLTGASCGVHTLVLGIAALQRHGEPLDRGLLGIPGFSIIPGFLRIPGFPTLPGPFLAGSVSRCHGDQDTCSLRSQLRADPDPGFPGIPEGLASNVAVQACAMAAGAVSYCMAERKHRRAFLEARHSLEVRLNLEEQSQQQERLMLSILPKHVADEMLKDMKKDPSQKELQQFNTMYMYRHENVSILFADIVGFTQLSSSCSAQELVKLLNELFARFDKLAAWSLHVRCRSVRERTHMALDMRRSLSIPIGHCPFLVVTIHSQWSLHVWCRSVRERTHTALDMHVGHGHWPFPAVTVHSQRTLSIPSGHCPFPVVTRVRRSVRERTHTALDMRVGVHSGAVLGGVLGQKRWQYDVWSTDVTVANKMEAGGVPGRVHVSQSTVDCLKGEFEVEPGEGGARCEYLRDRGIVTYLVVARPPRRGTINGLKLSLTSSHGASPPPPGTAPERNGSVRRSPEWPERPECPEEPEAGSRNSLDFGDDDGEAVANPSFPNPRRRLRLRDLAERVAGAAQDERELHRLLNEALLEREAKHA